MAVDFDRLVDDLEISRLLADYCASYDAGQWHEIARLFERGVRYVSDGVGLSGPANINAFLESSIRLYDGVPQPRHVLSNVRIDVSDDRTSAQSESVVIVFQVMPGEAPRILIQAAYHDKFVRSGSSWSFAERRATVDGTGDLSTNFNAA